jgi:hypothetical protein
LRGHSRRLKAAIGRGRGSSYFDRRYCSNRRAVLCQSNRRNHRYGKQYECGCIGFCPRGHRQKRHGIELKNLEEKRTAEISETKKKSESAQKFLDAKTEIEIAPLEEAAQEAEKMKGFISLYDNMRILQKSLETKQDRATQLDGFVELARAKPAELLQTIKLPVEGLGINVHGQITIDKLPIDNLSTFRKMKLALDIARTTCGEWHVICVDRLESLDAINQELFYKEIAEDDYQYFITTTELDKDADGNYITDLQVKAVG